MTHDIEAALYRLANTAWGVRRITPTSQFALDPEQLPRPESAGDMVAVVDRLYSHARKWAPGFEIPYRVPHVSLSPVISSAGQYRADSDGYLFIDIAPEFKGQHPALLAILAHEACHHVLDLSGVRGGTRNETERLTDLATFICGFGELTLAGHSQVRRVGSRWTTTHLGYLSSEEYRSAQRWVLTAQGLPSGIYAMPTKPRGLGARIRSWLVGATRPIVAPVPQPGAPVVHVTKHRQKVALARLGGDQALLQRLIEYERHRQPTANELELLDAVIESLERDRR